MGPTTLVGGCIVCFSVPDAQAKLIKEMAHRIEQLQDHIAALEMERETLKMWIRELVTFARHRGEKVQQLLSHPPEYWAQKVKEEK